MNLDPKLLRIFVTVLHSGSVTSAAEALNISQPSVSKAIRRLETVVGFKLFEPRGRSIQPTPEAQLLREDALRVERELESVRHRIIQIRHNQKRGIRVAAIPAIATVLLPQAVVEFQKQCPTATIEIELWHREKIVSEFDAGRIDIALIYSPSADVPAGFRVLANAPLRCLLFPDHRLVTKDVVTPDDLRHEKLVVYHHSLDMADMLWRLLESLTPTPQIIVEASQAAFLRDLVRRRVGISLIDGFTANDPTFTDMTSRPFKPVLPFYIAIAEQGSRMSLEAREFVSTLRAFSASLQNSETA